MLYGIFHVFVGEGCYITKTQVLRLNLNIRSTGNPVVAKACSRAQLQGRVVQCTQGTVWVGGSGGHD